MTLVRGESLSAGTAMCLLMWNVSLQIPFEVLVCQEQCRPIEIQCELRNVSHRCHLKCSGSHIQNVKKEPRKINFQNILYLTQ